MPVATANGESPTTVATAAAPQVQQELTILSLQAVVEADIDKEDITNDFACWGDEIGHGGDGNEEGEVGIDEAEAEGGLFCVHLFSRLINRIDQSSSFFGGSSGAWRQALTTHIFVACGRGYLGINTKKGHFWDGCQAI
jgi:hypothetical protein